MNPFFSICIPNYNYAQYLNETIDSVLSQDFGDFEIIIIDNCSTDNSWEIIRSFSDPRIKKYRNKYNIGFAPNLQVAISKSSGEFINILSADDKMKFGTLRKYFNVINSEKDKKNLFLLSDVAYIDMNSVEFGIEERNLSTFQSSQSNSSKYTGKGEVLKYTGIEILKKVIPQLKNPAPFLSVIVSSSLLKKVEGFNAIRTIGPDKFFNYKVLFQDPKILYIRIIGFQYRIHNSVNMVSQTTNIKQQIDDYLNTIEFSSIQLELIGVKREVLIDNFINRLCIKSGFSFLSNGNRNQAIRCLGFAIGSYPIETLKKMSWYILLILIITGPIGKLFINFTVFIRRFHNNRNK
jgi:glycosyltransferase involved in cell wall biosynthesis